MRLAFAVAAHLEPDILIVDEVLAVGDVGFQTKCLGKMGAVAAGGRTVIFVSHMLYAIEQLTERCLVLKDGTLCFDGETQEAVRLYQSFLKDPNEQAATYAAPQSVAHNHLTSAHVRTSDPSGVHEWGEPINFEFDLEITEPHSSLCFSFQVLNEAKQPIAHFWLYDADVPYRREPGIYRLQCHVPKLRLYMGAYTLRTWLTERRSSTVIESLQDICPFEVSMQSVHRDEYPWEAGAATYVEDAVWLPVECAAEETEAGLCLAGSRLSRIKRKLLVVSNLFPPQYVGGYELACADVVDGLRQRGWHPTVLTSWRAVGHPKNRRACSATDASVRLTR